MGKIKEFKITVSDEKSFYYAGDEINGTVDLELNQPLEMLRLFLAIQGRGKCSTGSKCNEEYLRIEVILFGTAPNTHGRNVTHPSGKHAYPFKFTLPESLPSSAIEQNGTIKYKLLGQITYKGIAGFVSKYWKVSSLVDVKERIDANLPEDRMTPIMQLQKSGGLFSNAKKLEKHALLISTERGVYCPTEEIKITIQYKDGQARKMGTVKAKLNKYILYNPKENKSCHSTKRIVKEVNDSKKYNDKIHQRVISIEVPDKSNPTNVLKNAVVINYIIHVKVEGYPEMKLPVIIGTIPFDESRALQGIVDNEAEPIEMQPSENPNFVELPTTVLPSYTPYNNNTNNHLSQPQLPPQPNQPPQANIPPYTNNAPVMNYPYMNNAPPASSLYPDLYIPEDEFDLPPSYEDTIASAPSMASLAPSISSLHSHIQQVEAK